MILTAIARKLHRLAFRARERSHHHWEYSGRLRFVSERIKQSGLQAAKILDVGGATGNNLLTRCGMTNVTTLDLKSSADIVASADAIPCADGAFEVVTCIDTLEHIPAELRSNVVRELVRVASRHVFIVAPVDSPENNLAERTVLRYVEDQFVREHQTHGLVRFAEIEAELESMRTAGRIKAVSRHELDNLHTWVFLMTFGHAPVSALYEDIYSLENRFSPRRVGLDVTVS